MNCERGWLNTLNCQVQVEAEQVEKEETRRKRRASSNVSPQIVPSGAPSKYATSPALSSKSSPKSAISPFLQPEKSPALDATSQDWVEVRGNTKSRKSSDPSMASPKVKAEPAAVPPSPKGGKKGEAGKDGKGKGKTSLMSLDESASARHLRLADFIKPQENARGKGKGAEAKKSEKKSDAAESGPSAILVSALQSAGKADQLNEKDGSAKWSVQPKDGNPKMSQILEDAMEHGHAMGSKETKKKQNQVRKESKVMTCSWGRDALPSEQSKNQSIAEIQQEEELLREHDEILEIEAWDIFC